VTNIVQVVGDGTRSGGTTYVIQLARSLLRDGHCVTVITNSGSFLEEHARRLGASAIGLKFNFRANTPALAIQLRHHLRNIHPEIVHAHGSRGGLPTALASYNRSWRLVYTVHGLHYNFRRQPLRWLGWMAEKVCMRRADKTVFVAHHDEEVARKDRLLVDGSQSIVVGNAVSVDIVPQPTEDRVYDIGFLGRLSPQKNPLLLCDVLVAMRPLRPTLVLIGGGPLQGEIRSRIDKLGLTSQIIVTGELPRREALGTLARCRTFVLPSVHEGQPLAVMEAAHLGLPAVVSSLPGIKEIVDEAETGYCVPVYDVAGYADRLSRLLMDPDLARRMSLAAKRRAARDFNFERIVDAYSRIYELPRTRGPSLIEPAGRFVKVLG
jgi:glycosyltransferase involved in cell wall biosynthesis